MYRNTTALFGGALTAVGLAGVHEANAQEFAYAGYFTYGRIVLDARVADDTPGLIDLNEIFTPPTETLRYFYTSSYINGGYAYAAAGATADSIFLTFGTPESFQYHNHSISVIDTLITSDADLLVTWDISELLGFSVGGIQPLASITVEEDIFGIRVNRLLNFNSLGEDGADLFPESTGSIRVPLRGGGSLLTITLRLRVPDTEPSLSSSGVAGGNITAQLVEPLPDDSGLPITSEQIADLDRDGDADLDDILLYFAAFADFSQQP